MRSFSQPVSCQRENVGIHDVGVGVGVDNYHFGLALAVDLYARERVPAREFHLRRIAKYALRINHVNQAPRVVRPNQGQQRECKQGCVSAWRARFRPNHPGSGHRNSRAKNNVRSA